MKFYYLLLLYLRFLVYSAYFAAGRGSITLPLCLLSIIFMQGAQVMTSYWYVHIFLVQPYIDFPTIQVGILAGDVS